MSDTNQTTKLKQKTFYLYDFAGNLVTKAKKIYSPYNIKTLGRTVSEDYYRNPDAVEFRDGQYTVDSSKLSPLVFEQQLEWLSFYNPVGGTLNKGGPGQEHLNGLHYRTEGIHIIKEEMVENTEVKINTVEKVVEVQQIPKIIAENMNVGQLRDLAAAWNVELPEDIMQVGDAEKIQATIIETMTQAGHIK